MSMISASTGPSPGHCLGALIAERAGVTAVDLRIEVAEGRTARSRSFKSIAIRTRKETRNHASCRSLVAVNVAQSVTARPPGWMGRS